MVRFRRVADRWERWLESVHTDLPYDEEPQQEQDEEQA